MTRVRVAVALGVVAVLAVLGTSALVVATYGGGDEPGTSAVRLRVTDARTGASIRLPAGDWSVRKPGERVSYAAAHLDGPALLGEGYCRARPAGSFRAVVGFTEQTFDAWRASLSSAAATEHRDRVVLPDGRPATVRWVALPGGGGPCAAPGIELAMVVAGDVRAVLVADTGVAGTLGHDEIKDLLSGLRLPH